MRGINRLLPLGRKYHPLIWALNGRKGVFAIPFDKFHVLRPAAWTKSVTTQLLSGTAIIPEFELLKPICSALREGFLVDVGANIGLYTLLLRSASNLPIISYEPQPFLYKLLGWNIAYNKLSGIETRNVACGSQRGEISFSIGLNGSVVPPAKMKTGQSPGAPAAAIGNLDEQARVVKEGKEIVKVPVITLDEDLASVPRIAFLKIDCEGFEYQILLGAKKLLAKHRPLLFVELHPEQIHDFGGSPGALLELLAPDYELEFWHFRSGRYASKIARSFGKFRKPKARRYADAQEMLAAAANPSGPAQIYCLGRPRRNGNV